MWINFQSYRAYKWAIKRPQCASQILCTINEKNELDQEQPRLRNVMSKMTSFPAAWAVSNKLGTNFWTLYGAIMEHDICIVSNILTRRNVYWYLYKLLHKNLFQFLAKVSSWLHRLPRRGDPNYHRKYSQWTLILF